MPLKQAIVLLSLSCVPSLGLLTTQTSLKKVRKTGAETSEEMQDMGVSKYDTRVFYEQSDLYNMMQALDEEGKFAGCKAFGPKKWSSKHTDLNFIHIPRTGGSTIESCQHFFPNGTTRWGGSNAQLHGEKPLPKTPKRCFGQHVPPSILAKFQKKHPYTKRESNFCVVRNPYNRLISQYGFAVNNNFVKDGKGMNCTAASLNGFLKKNLLEVKAGNPFKGDCHMTPASFFVFGYDAEKKSVDRKEKWCTHMLRYENLHQDFNTLMEKFGYGVRITAANASDSTHMGSSPECRGLSTADLSPEVISLANEIYKEDFELLGYKRIAQPLWQLGQSIRSLWAGKAKN